MTDALNFSTFTDAPVDLAAAPADQPVTKRIQIAEIGKFSDPRYGTFAITAQDVDSWKRLLEEEFQGEVPLDFDHNTDKAGPTGSKAGGWIKSIVQEGKRVLADVEFTPSGAQSVRDREYRYISPTFVSDYKDKQQKSRGPALLRAALTNNPFLRDMPAISLSAAPLEAERVELDAPVGIGVGDRVALSNDDLTLGKEGTCVAERPDEESGSFRYDVTFDDGTRAEGLWESQLRSLTPWASLTLASPEAPEPAADPGEVAIALAKAMEQVARLANSTTRR